MNLLRVAWRYCKACDIHVTVTALADLAVVSEEVKERLIAAAECDADHKMHQHWLARHAHVSDTPEGRLAALEASATILGYSAHEAPHGDETKATPPSE